MDDRIARAQKTRALIGPCSRDRDTQLTGHPAQRSRGGMADAYGSGPYGETRGGSTPLVSRRRHILYSFTEYLSIFANKRNQAKYSYLRGEQIGVHRKVDELAAKVTQQQSSNTRLRTEIEELKIALKEQAGPRSQRVESTGRGRNRTRGRTGERRRGGRGIRCITNNLRSLHGPVSFWHLRLFHGRNEKSLKPISPVLSPEAKGSEPF